MKLLNKIGLIALLIPILSGHTEVLHKEANQFTGLVAPMYLQDTTSSPTGSRIYTTTVNSGEALYEFELDEVADFEVEALLLADTTTRNSFRMAINTDPAIDWEVDPESTYTWRKINQVFHGEAGIQQIRVQGLEPYTRLAAIRINKIPEPVHEILEVSVSDAIVTPPMVITAETNGDYASTAVANQGEIDFSFMLLESAQVHLNLFAMGLNGSADSFYLKHTDGSLEAIHLGTSADYRWKEGPLLNLEAGSHTIKIVGRESNARIKMAKLVKVIQETPVLPLAVSPSRFDNDSSPVVLNATGLSDAVTKVNSAQPNTKVILPSGTFDGFLATLTGSGVEGAPVILEGRPDGSTIITGKINITLKGSHFLLKNINVINYDSNVYSGGAGVVVFDECSYCGLQNSRFENSIESLMNSEGKDQRHFKTVLIKPTSQSVEVARNTFKTKRNQGSVILINRDVNRTNLHEGHRIFSNLFLDRHLEGNKANDFDVIRIGDSTSSQTPSPQNAEDLMTGSEASLVGTTVEFNLFEGTTIKPSVYSSCESSNGWNTSTCKGEPEIISIKAPQTLVRFNTFRNNSGGVTLRHGFQSIIEGNYFSGTNTPQGITSIMPNSYGIRIIGENHLVVNNHIENLSNVSTQLGAISVHSGVPSPLNHEYWKVFQTLITGNFIKNGTSKPVSIATDYGYNNKTVLPESIIFSQNGFAECSQAVFNQAPTESYLSTFRTQDNLYDCDQWGLPSLPASTQVPLMTVNVVNGFQLPLDPALISESGILYNKDTKLSGNLTSLSGTAGAAAAERMTKLSQFLLIKRGTLYQNYLPLNREDVGSNF